MSKLWTTPVGVQYPVKFYSGGDTTRDAFGKHIQEIERIYGLLNGLDAAKVSASDVSNLTNLVNSLNNRVNNLNTQNTQTNSDIGAINDRIDNLEQEVERNKPQELKYRIMEEMYSPVQKNPNGSGDNLIQDTWTKGTDSKLSYAVGYDGEANYRVFKVPNGVYKLVIDACGGGGGGWVNSGHNLICGGNASSIKNGLLNVKPGDKLYIYPGRGGKGCYKTLTGDNTCSDGEDTEVKLGSSSSTASTATQIIYCYGGYGAENIKNNSPEYKLPNINALVSGYTRYYQGPSNIRTPEGSDYQDTRYLLMGMSSESTLIPPYGEGGAFNTSWARSDNYTGTYGVVVIRYVGIY